MKKFYTLFLIALMGIGSVWAQTYDGGTWYSLLQNHEFNQGSLGTLTKEFDVFPPTASSMSFQWKNKKFWFNGTFGSVNLKFYESTDGSSYGEEQQVVNCDVGTDKTSYQSDSYPILNPSQLLKFKFTLGTSYGAWVSYLKLPLAKHILLKDNTAYGKTTVSKTFTQETRIGDSSNIRADFRSFLTAGNISISLTEGDAEVFRLGSADNTSGVLTTSTAGNSYAVGANACASANGTAAACANGKLGKIDNYSFQIYFCPKAVGEATAKITITDGTSTATITVKATGIKAETLEVPVELSFCAGGSVEFHGKTYEAAGTDVVEATGATRDTVYNVTVSVLQPSFGSDAKTIVYGAQETWNEIDLSTYMVGKHEIPFNTTNVAGCDSTVTLTLTVNKQETLEVPVDLSFCAGDSAEFRGKWYFSAEDSEEISAEGATRDTLYVVNVTVLQPSFGTDEMTIVYGDEVEWNGIALKDSAVGAHYVEFVTTNVAGCDSTVTLTLTVNKIETLEVPVDLAFCAGDSVEYRGVYYTEAGAFDVPAEGATRDTVYKVNVTVLQPSFGTEEMAITVGDDVEWNGIALKDSTVGVHSVVAVLTNAAGCDSTVTLTLTVNKLETLEVPVDLSFCAGGSEWYREVEYSEAGVFDVPAVGETRDTVYKVNVVVLQPSFVEEDMTIIVGTDTAWNGIALKDSTVGVHYVEFVTTNVAGCDSTVTLTLTVNKMDTLEVYYPIGFCTGDSAEYRGKWYYENALDTIYAEGDVRDTIIYVEAMLLPTTDLLVLYDTIVSGNEVILPEGEWVIGEDTVSGTYPTVESEDASELIFHQYFDEPVVCGPNYIELIVTVTPKEQKPGDTTTDIEDVLDAQKAEKVLIDGVLYIRRGEKVYTASGELVK